MEGDASVGARSKLRLLVCGLALVVVTALITSQVASQDKPANEPTKQQPEEKMDPMMAAWMKYAVPGEHHAHLNPLVGTWTQAIKWRMDPAGPEQESTGQCQAEWILGGRFLLQRVKGAPVMGQPFEGLGIFGYDNYGKKYVSVWVDNMTTMVMTADGQRDRSGKVITFVGEYADPFTGKMLKTRSVYHLQNKDKYTIEMFNQGPDGKEFRAMEITQTRKPQTP